MRLNSTMGKRRTVWNRLLGWALGAACVATAAAARAEDARSIVQQAVSAEQAASRDDHTLWKYMQHEANGDSFVVVETRSGSVKRHVMQHGHPASEQTLAADDAYNDKFVHDPALRAKQKHDDQHDDKSAKELLNQMADAFVWRVEGDSGDGTSLSYRPNPDFSPPSMESRVMSAMTGTMVVSKPGHRIKTFTGRLMDDVTIGWGMLARIRAGSTFDVERREVGPGLWQITETHVHIGGHALFFKTIGQQQDEINSDFTQVPQDTTLEQAVAMLQQPAGAARAPCCSAK
jgi:hypothetical protein